MGLQNNVHQFPLMEKKLADINLRFINGMQNQILVHTWYV